MSITAREVTFEGEIVMVTKGKNCALLVKGGGGKSGGDKPFVFAMDELIDQGFELFHTDMVWALLVRKVPAKVESAPSQPRVPTGILGDNGREPGTARGHRRD